MNEASRAMPNAARRHWLGWVVMGASIAAVVAGTLVPAVDIGWLRSHVPLFATAWDKLDATFPWVNPLHIIFYTWLAFGWRLLTPRWPRWRLPVLLALIGIAGELLQFFAPGRQPRVGDAVDDWIGIAIGLSLAWAVMRWRRDA